MGGESVTIEPTMADKLASLGLLDRGLEKHSTGEEPSTILDPPRADSALVRLKQALHAEDHALLLNCLHIRDEMVIANTTAHLTPADVLKLLKSLIPMVQSRGAVLVCVLPWLRSLLSQHASSIASQESSLIILNSLYQLIQSRISTYGSALQLSTSLDVLFARIPDDESDDEGTGPAVIYEDEDSDEDENGDAMDTDGENEELGAVINSPLDSDGSEGMSD